MLFYCWPHCVYHFMQWFPPNNRLKARVVALLFSLLLIVPPFYVLFTPSTMQRFCEQPLLSMLVATIIIMWFMLSFAVIFAVMDPVPWMVKMVFHVFGVISLVFSIIHFVMYSRAYNCRVYTQELYYMTMGITIIDMVAVGCYALVVPFWIANKAKENCALDQKERNGICYEPVKCCPCVWHI